MRALIFLSLIAVFLGCAPSKSNRQASQTATFIDKSPSQPKALNIEMPKVTVTVPPVDLDIVCGEKKCPSQVGLLVFTAGEQNKSGTSTISVCTAFLIASDMIMSNGHCDHTSDMAGIFVGQKINGKPVSSSVAGVVYKKYTPAANSSSTKNPDVAIFKLSSPITSMKPLVLASGPQINFTTLTAYAIFTGDQMNQFKVLARECSVRRHETHFPYALKETPDLIHSFDCKMVKGNSGSPMFAPNSEDVQAVHFANSDLEETAAFIRKDQNRDLMAHEKHLDSLATNVRCLDYPGAKPVSCVRASLDENNKRWQATQRFEMDKLLQREFPGAERYPVKFEVVRQQFKIASPILEFELIYVPKCRVQANLPNGIPFVFEKLRLVPDEWANMKAESQSVTTVDMNSRPLSGTAVVIEPKWPPAPENLLDPANDHRKLNQNPFRIDLPLCPR